MWSYPTLQDRLPDSFVNDAYRTELGESFRCSSRWLLQRILIFPNGLAGWRRGLGSVHHGLGDGGLGLCRDALQQVP